MADPDDGALREQLARDEARLAAIEIERARIARRIVELKARLSAGTPPAGGTRHQEGNERLLSGMQQRVGARRM